MKYPNGFESGIHKDNQQAQLGPFLKAPMFSVAVMAAAYVFLTAIQ